MLRAHKIRLQPNQIQETYFRQACGTARFAWNWALAEWQKQYEAHNLDPTRPKPSEGELRKQLNAIKDAQFPWMREVTKSAPQEAIRNLGTAYKNWFSSLSGKRKGPKVGAPRPKKKHKHDCFKFDEKFKVEGSRIHIPKLGWVRMREPLRFEGKLIGATVSRTADAWFVSVLVDTDVVPESTVSTAAVGVDLGVKSLAVLSSGETFEGPTALGNLLCRLRRLSRAHSRKTKGSANRRKSAQKLARLHARITNVRSNALHQLSHSLTKNHGWVAMEDLNVKGMMANRKLSRHIADQGFGELRRQLTYKAEQRGVVLAVVDRFYPSSKTCNDCGHVKEDLTLSNRHWVCGECGVVHDRDVNAARNILNESARVASMKDTAPGVGVSACGEGSAGLGRKTKTKLPSEKQDVKHKVSEWPHYG